MAYKSCLILSMCVLFGLGLLPPWQGGRLSISPTPAQTATATRPTFPTETSTPSSTVTLKPTLTATGTPSSTPSPTPTLPPTPTPTATAALSLTPPSPCPCLVYLPLVSAIPPTVIQEAEPNDTFAQAQNLPALPASVNGTHDGEADTGDVYQIELTAGQIVHVILTTDNPTGVQLLAYSGENPTEIVRDFVAPFELTFLAIATDTYFLYVFTPGEVKNTGAYTLSAALSEASP